MTPGSGENHLLCCGFPLADCVAGKCSCQLSPTPPKVYAKAKMETNDTIVIGFTILANEQLRKEQDSHLHEALQAYKMQLK